MKIFMSRIILFLFISMCSFSATAASNDATTQLFSLLDKGDCIPSSLTGIIWTITTQPIGTHGELNWGDQLVFEQRNRTTSLSRKGKFNIWRNGTLWDNTSGWSGSCVRDGTLSLYVVTGEIDIDGCPHELAISRLDHDDNLAKKIEVIFQESGSEQMEECEEFNILHPGHAHGTN